MKKTLIIGATTNQSRFAHLAARRLDQFGHPIVLFGIKKGEVAGHVIQNEFPDDTDIHTVTLYLNPLLQHQYYADILGLNPKRIIFNPGTENDELRELAEAEGIETEYACTLVLLNSGQYD